MAELNSAGAASVCHAKVADQAPTGTIVVLVVEDDVLLRTLAVEFFADMGFDTVEAPDANSAIRVLQIDAHASSAPRSPKLALDRFGGNVGVCHMGARTIARKHPVFSEAL